MYRFDHRADLMLLCFVVDLISLKHSHYVYFVPHSSSDAIQIRFSAKPSQIALYCDAMANRLQNEIVIDLIMLMKCMSLLSITSKYFFIRYSWDVGIFNASLNRHLIEKLKWCENGILL